MPKGKSSEVNPSVTDGSLADNTFVVFVMAKMHLSVNFASMAILLYSTSSWRTLRCHLYFSLFVRVHAEWCFCVIIVLYDESVVLAVYHKVDGFFYVICLC